MKKEFVPNEQALELKELGFDEQCLGYYDTEGLKISSDWYLNPQNKNSLFPEPHTTNNPKISAPLYQQAFRWFREKYGIGSWIHHYFDMDKGTFIYSYVLTLPHRGEEYVYDTYEEAELACLIKLIEIVKTK
jgi:hypothetical protein